MDYKKTNATTTTVTRDITELESKTANIYNTIAILAKRSNQISLEIREELLAKLAEFATVNDSIEEIFENREQIEISKFYEKLSKPTLIAIQELLDDAIYFRTPSKEEELQKANQDYNPIG